MNAEFSPGGEAQVRVGVKTNQFDCPAIPQPHAACWSWQPASGAGAPPGHIDV